LPVFVQEGYPPSRRTARLVLLTQPVPPFTKALDKIAADEFRSTNSVILQLLDEKLKSKGIDWRKEDDESQA